METGEYKIKLTGVANIPRPLKLGCSYDLEIKEVECRKTEQVPNDDGSMDEIAKLQISELSEVVLKSGDKTMKATKKGSQSKILRYFIEQKADSLGVDREKYYQSEMQRIIDSYKL